MLRPSEIREMLKVIEKRKIISFTGGFPDPNVFPVKEFIEISKYVLETYDGDALQYTTTKGVKEFREVLKNYLINKGVSVKSDDDIIVTTASQQALYMLGKILINPGDIVIVELPTYLAALNAFRVFRPEIIGIPMDENGMLTHVLETEVRRLRGLGKKIKLIYTVPTAHNPTGITMNLERRKHLLEIASENDILIIEDDPYSYFTYESINVTPLKTLDKDNRVIYVGTFSKILAPGLRLGWVLANKVIVDYLERAKQIVDLHAPTYSQYIALEAIKRGIVDKTIEKARKVYKFKRDVMLEALEEYMSKIAWWAKPIGGLFVFVWLKDSIDTKKLLPKAIDAGVAYVPGAPFFADGSGRNTMRLNFSYPKPEDIRQGIKILSTVINKELSTMKYH